MPGREIKEERDGGRGENTKQTKWYALLYMSSQKFKSEKDVHGEK